MTENYIPNLDRFDPGMGKEAGFEELMEFFRSLAKTVSVKSTSQFSKTSQKI